LWLEHSGYRRRASSIVQAKDVLASSASRSSSATQNFRSNDALCATTGSAPTKRAASGMTSPTVGAPATMVLVMPVR
jgi:hypothetical protein